MDRWKIFTVILMVMIIVLLSYNIIQTAAQDEDPPEGPILVPETGDGSENQPENELAEDNEEVILAPDVPSALVSSSFVYQGQLNQGGAPVNTQCDFIWNLFTDSSGGLSLANDSDTNVQLTNGLFTDSIDVPISVFDGNRLYLEIQVRCPAGSGSYTLLTPRQELKATPYALGLRLPFSHTISNSGAPIFAVTNTSTSTSSPSFLGSSAGGDGVRGLSTGAGSADNGVYGETNSPANSEAGVKGASTSETSFGGYFTNSATTTSGGALFANGDAKQTLAADGFVKAAVYLACMDTGSSINRYFNNVNTMAIMVIDGSGPGRCTVDFGFSVRDNRYVVATAYGGGVARIVTFDPGSTVNRIDFFRFDQDGTGVDGYIMVLVY